MPLVQTRGAASAQGFGEFAQADGPVYVEDVFSPYVYAGTGSAQTITNDINLAGKGGLVWTKVRNNADSHWLGDTVRGAGYVLESQSTNQSRALSSYTSFNSNGYSIAQASTDLSGSGKTYVSWTFREQPKFFDIVTYTGNGANRTIAHNLGSAPGCMIIKATSAIKDWAVYHRSTGNTKYLSLNTTASAATSASYWNNTTPTSTVFTVGIDGDVNQNGVTYVAYLFAHDAGGFGLAGTDNVISCGGYTGNNSTVLINLGYEPQLVIIRNITSSSSPLGDWKMIDNMRGFVADPGNSAILKPNLSDAENNDNPITIASNGFYNDNLRSISNDYIYIAIRRGPMKVPTTGTSVFAPVTGNFSSPYTVTTNFPVDLTISSRTAGATRAVNDRLRGGTTNSYAYLNTATTDAELTGTGAGLGFQNNTAVIDTNWQTGGNALWWNFRRAPSFFDEVCYTGTGTLGQTYSHNLGVAPELIILKCRAGGSYSWPVWNKDLAASGSNRVLALNLPQAFSTDNGAFNSTAPTASVFTVGNNFSSNGGTGYTYVAYLFATCAGVSKVGSYTGTGATQTIDCGFGAGGARFVLIKRTDVSADWWVWDSARGMIAGTDPRIDLNAGNPQTNANWVYTISTGFQIVTTDASVNASGGTYIFLAIA